MNNATLTVRNVCSKRRLTASARIKYMALNKRRPATKCVCETANQRASRGVRGRTVESEDAQTDEPNRYDRQEQPYVAGERYELVM